LDFDETYAPIARLESIQILLTYASYHGFKLYQMDVKSAFLNGPIKRCMLSNLPALKIVIILHMFISSQRRFMGSNKPQEHGMNACETFLSLKVLKSEKADPTLFTKTIDKDLFICQIYVDYIIFGSTRKSSCEEFSRIMI
jgi:hypothetical protein